MAFFDIHILQSVPPSNINRDDTGSPKTATYGGVRRARVSSQAWKRATRKYFNLNLDKSDIGQRTKRIAELLADEIGNAAPELAGREHRTDALKLAADTLKVAGLKLAAPKVSKKDKDKEHEPNELAEQSAYLVFMSTGQFRNLAELAISAHLDGTKVTAKAAKAAFNSDHSFDVALFGRMVADDAELNVDAAAQVAHAISVHAVDNEYDYFTAVDDLQERDQETGAGMIGTVEFNSSTLYRYATVNTDGLLKNLGDPAATARATAVFVEAFVRSMPSGKQNTFANGTLPDAVIVTERTDQPVNLVASFEDPILTGSGNLVGQAAEAFAKRHHDTDEAYGNSAHTWVVALGAAVEPLRALGDVVNLDGLVAAVEARVAESLVVQA